MNRFHCGTSLVLVALSFAVEVRSASAAGGGNTVFFEDFDLDNAASWTVNDNGNGLNSANFFFDYAQVGIPSAPNSVGTTLGLKMNANLHFVALPPPAPIPAISVSPTGLVLDGDYEVRFDWWANYVGPLDSMIGPGTTQLSTFGVMSSGAFANGPGQADAVFFAATGDGRAAADFRAYAPERVMSYQSPPISPLDAHATYFAGSRSASNPYYHQAFPGGEMAPFEQMFISPFQTGFQTPGATGFRWHDVQIQKVGQLITWLVNGVPLISVDASGFVAPTGGGNIIFGHADVNFGGSPFPFEEEVLQFTLIDNIRVFQAVPEPTSIALVVAAAAMAWATAARRRRVA
jgi:hypothetical protein